MYYADSDNYNKKNIDYDLWACLHYNKQDFMVDDIKKVLAIIEGENEEAEWVWVLKLKNQFVYLVGGCDYTGWDCQSWATAIYFDNKKSLKRFLKEKPEGEVLLDQLKSKKMETWREKMDKEFHLA